MITWGISAAYLFGVLCYYDNTREDSWPIVLVPILISLTEGAFFYFFLTYESPVFLWLQGQHKKVKSPKALEVVNFINNESMPVPLTDGEDEDIDTSSQVRNPSFWEVLTKELYRKPMFMACGLSMFQQFGGVNAIIMSAPIILKSCILVDPVWLVVIVGAANTLSAMLTLFFIDCEEQVDIKRTRILQIGGVGMAIAMALLVVSYFDKSQTAQTVLAVSGCALFTVMFEISIGTVQYLPLRWFYNAELLPPKGLAIATATNWGGNTVISVLCAFVLTTKYGPPVLYSIFASVNLLVSPNQLVVFSHYLIETKDMSPEDLEEKLRCSIKTKFLA